ncbi:MAG: ComEC/Rec2 family competence protein [Cytophagaceae bacterium]
MFNWQAFPFLRYIIFFIPGILTGIYYEFPERILFIPLILFIALLGFKLFEKKHQFFYIIKTVRGIMALIATFFCGASLHFFYDQRNEETHFSHHSDITSYTAKVLDEEKATAKYYTYVIKIEGIKNGEKWIATTGKLFLYVNKSAGNFHRNDQILIIGHPKEIRNAGNPGEFDNQLRFKQKNIYHQHFAQARHVTKIGHVEEKSLSGYSYSLRKKLLAKLNENFSNPANTQIAAAILLGDKKDLDKELRSSYASTGAMHILAVSGLHVGILFLFLNFIVGKLQKIKPLKWVIPLFIIALLWFYAFLTGLSPSVMRAVTMFTFIQLGINYFRSSNIFNTIAISAVILLIINPYNISNIGFQLSYSAVMGILLLYQRIYNYWLPENYILDKAWQVIAVSISAQAGTSILSLYYFNQFPTYFLITNLLITLPVYIITLGGFLILSIAAILPVHTFIYQLLEYSIDFLNALVRFIESLPGGLIAPIYLSAFEAVALTLLLICVLGFILYKKSWLIYISLCTGICLAVYSIFIHYNHVHQKGIVVYNIPGSINLALIKGNEALIVTDGEPSRVKFVVKNHLTKKGINYRIIQTDELHSQKLISYSRPNHNTTLLAWEGRIIVLSTDGGLPEKAQNYYDYLISQKGDIVYNISFSEVRDLRKNGAFIDFF